MTKRIVMLFLSLLLVMPLLTVTANASGRKLFDLDFIGGTINEKVPGLSWQAAEDVTLVDDRLRIGDGWIDLDPDEATSIVSAINDDLDFTVDFNVEFEKWDGDKSYILDIKRTSYALSILYDKDHTATGAWRLRMTDASTPGTYTYYTLDDNLSLDTEYSVSISRVEDTLVVKRGGALVGSVPLGFTDAVADVGSSRVVIGTKDQDGIFYIRNFSFTVDSGNAAEELASVGVTGDTLKFTPESIMFSTIIINHDIVTDSTSTSKISVNDESGIGTGWVIQASGTSFLSSPLVDPSSGGKAKVVIGIPVSALTLNVGAPVSLSGQSVHPTYGPFGNNITMSSSPQTILTAESGYGMGSYDIPLNFTLRVPKTGIVNNIVGTGSKYSQGDSVGIVAGTYLGRITYTVAAPL